jgi:hypothetical protein
VQVPVGALERLYAMAAMIVGLTIFSWFISAFSKSLQLLKAADVWYAEQQQAVEAFSAVNRLPRDLCRRVNVSSSLVS